MISHFLMRKQILLFALPFFFACQLSAVLEPPSTPTPSPQPALVSENPENPVNDSIEIIETVVESIPNGPFVAQAVPLPAVIYAPFGVAEPAPVIVPAVVPLYTPDLNQVNGLESLDLSAVELETLGEDGYLLRPDQVGSLQAIYKSDGAHMVTTDLVLLLSQAIQHDVLQDVFEQANDRQSYDLLTGLIAETKEQLATAEDTLARQAAAKNLAIFSMGGKFYDENWPIEPEVAELVETELALFQNSGEFESPLLGRRVNYQSIRLDPLAGVRVHIWFLLSSPVIDLEQSPAEQRLAGKQIELLLDIWSAGAVPAWQANYLRTRYNNGTEMPTVEAWLALSQSGVTGDAFVQSAVQANLTRFQLLPSAKPTSQTIFEPLLFNSVGAHASPENAPATAKQEAIGLIRDVPRLIDVAAAFGSELALEQLIVEGEAGYAGWEQQMAGLKMSLADGGNWPPTLQFDTLSAIQPLANPVPGSYPAYMRSAGGDRLTVWETGFLISTISRFETSAQTLTMPADQPVFVEPRPELYANLAAQTRILANGLLANQMLDAGNADKLLALESDLLRLQAIAQRGLGRVRPSAAETEFLANLLRQVATVEIPDNWGVRTTGESGWIDAKNRGMAPAIFIVLDGSQQVAVQGARLQIAIR